MKRIAEGLLKKLEKYERMICYYCPMLARSLYAKLENAVARGAQRTLTLHVTGALYLGFTRSSGLFFRLQILTVAECSLNAYRIL